MKGDWGEKEDAPGLDLSEIDPRDPTRIITAPEEIGGQFTRDLVEWMKLPENIDAVERARWGMAVVGTAQQQRFAVAKFHSDAPVPVICQCLPDNFNAPPEANLRYVIEYGSGSAMRISGLLLPGMWIAHGTDVLVIAITTNIAAAQVRAAAFLTPSPGSLPNIP